MTRSNLILMPEDIDKAAGVSMNPFSTVEQLTSSISKEEEDKTKFNPKFEDHLKDYEILWTKQAPDTYGFVEVHEEESAKKLVEELLGGPAPVVCGYDIAVLLYVRGQDIDNFIDPKTGKPMAIVMAETVSEKARLTERYDAVSGLVIAVGPEAFSGSERFKNPELKKPFYRVGDWVSFTRGRSRSRSYLNKTICLLASTDVDMILRDPRDVMRG